VKYYLMRHQSGGEFVLLVLTYLQSDINANVTKSLKRRGVAGLLGSCLRAQYKKRDQRHSECVFRYAIVVRTVLMSRESKE